MSTLLRGSYGSFLADTRKNFNKINIYSEGQVANFCTVEIFCIEVHV